MGRSRAKVVTSAVNEDAVKVASEVSEDIG
jgi:hypothetical protein